MKFAVIPAHAGIQGGREWRKNVDAAIRCGWRDTQNPRFSYRFWIPAFAGMTNTHEKRADTRVRPYGNPENRTNP